ncbi:hypothetical protein D3C79_849690 [compost metagenome]
MQAQPCVVVEHLRVGAVDQGGAAARLHQRGRHQHHHDGQQAQAGEQGDLPLNEQAAQQHGDVLVLFVKIRRVTEACQLNFHEVFQAYVELLRGF